MKQNIQITNPTINNYQPCILTYIWLDKTEGWDPNNNCGGYQFAYSPIEKDFGPNSDEYLDPEHADNFICWVNYNGHTVPVFEID